MESAGRSDSAQELTTIQSPYVCGFAVTLTPARKGVSTLGPRGHQELGSVKLERGLSQPQRRGCELQARAPPTGPLRSFVEALPETLLPGPQTMGTNGCSMMTRLTQTRTTLSLPRGAGLGELQTKHGIRHSCSDVWLHSLRARTSHHPSHLIVGGADVMR